MLGPNKKSRFAGTKNRKNIRRDKRYYFKKMSVSEEVTTTVTTPVGKKHVGEYVVRQPISYFLLLKTDASNYLDFKRQNEQE